MTDTALLIIRSSSYLTFRVGLTFLVVQCIYVLIQLMVQHVNQSQFSYFNPGTLLQMQLFSSKLM